MKQQEHTTPAVMHPPATRSLWVAWLDLLPGPHTLAHTREILIDAWAAPPCDEDIEHAVDGALARARWIDLGADDDGLPIIAAEVLIDVWLMAYPDGEEIAIYRRREEVMGWQTLDEFDAREHAGEGVVEEREREGANFWVWRAAA
jgi:hypothetical protein